MTASVAGATRSSPRRIVSSPAPRRHRPDPARAADPGRARGAPHRVSLRHARDPLRGGVPEHDTPLPVDRDDAVCDVGEDRLAPLLLVADALVEIRVQVGGRRGRRQRRERLLLFQPPPSRLATVHGEDPDDAAVRADDRDTEIQAVRGSQERVGLAHARVAAGISSARLERVCTMSPISQAVEGVRTAEIRLGLCPANARRTNSSSSSVRTDAPSACRIATAERAVASSTSSGSSRRELAPGASEPLGDRASGTLALVELAPLERASGRAGDVPGQLELALVEDRLLAEEREHEPELVARALDERDREQ